MTSAAPAWAQEEKYLDKKPRCPYGPATTYYITLEGLKDNLGRFRSLAHERRVGNIHRFTFVQCHGNRLQNLGNNGTATKPIYFLMPQQIGITSGFCAYDAYFRSPAQIRYYDTKSPYTCLHTMLARFGSLYADVCHTRNVTPYWNIGVNFRHMRTDKEWIPDFSPGDRNAMADGLDVSTHLKTPDGSYQLVAHALIMKHRVRETGGIGAWKSKGLYNYKKEKELLEFQKLWKQNAWVDNRLRGYGEDAEPESSDYRRRFHLYHQLALRDVLWAYHELEIEKQACLFKITLEKASSSNASKKDSTNKTVLGGSPSDLEEQLKYTNTLRTIGNEAGLKGEWRDFFWRSYYRHKNLAWKPHHTSTPDDGHEHYAGLRTRYHLAADNYAHLGGEYLFGGLYKARAGYTTPLWEVAGERATYAPSLLSQRYHAYQRQWNNAFRPITATQMRGSVRLGISGVLFRPGICLTRVENPVYFEYDSENWFEQDLVKRNPKFERPELNAFAQKRCIVAKPHQAAAHANVMVIDADLDFAPGMGIHWDNTIVFAQTFGPEANAFKVPDFMINSKLYYARETESGNAVLETGIDLHAKTSYKADAYDPVTQQFYVQDAFTVYSYPVVDLFCNFRISSFVGFAKLSHINEYVPSPSYFVTPFYPGQRLAFDVGFNWSFFD